MRIGGQWRRSDYEAVERMLGDRTGLAFPPSRREGVEAGIRRALARTSTWDPAQYIALIQTDQSALDQLLAELTIGETYLLRDPAQFEFIRREVIPDLLSCKSTVRAWSAGCATGEEAYSLAILLHELGCGGSARILGTDISRERLARAREACYTRWSLRGVPDAVIEEHFRRRSDRFELRSQIRNAVEFRHLNLAEDIYPSLRSGIWGMDLILCRNVLIYLDRETVARVARRLIDSLSDEGWLLLGASDPPLSEFVPCEVVITNAGIAYRRPGCRTAVTPKSSAEVAPLSAHSSSAGEYEPISLSTSPRKRSDRISPASIRARVAQDSSPEIEPARRDETEVDLCIARVRSLANQGQLADAGRACATALDRYPTSAELLYLHSVLLAEAGMHREAAQAARSALYMDRDLVVAHLSLGRALTRLGDAEGAQRAIRNAERLLSSMPPAEVVPASDEESAGRLTEMVRAQLRLLGEEAA